MRATNALSPCGRGRGPARSDGKVRGRAAWANRHYDAAMSDPEINSPYALRRPTRILITFVAVGLVWGLGIFYVPPSWRTAIYAHELKILSYGLLAVFFAIYALTVTRFRWSTLAFGLVAGYVAGAVGDALATSIFDYERSIEIFARDPWQGLASPLMVSLALNIWLGGLCAGALAIILQSAAGRLARRRSTL
jgi:hypothetical protein